LFRQPCAEPGAAEQEQPRAFRAGFGFGLEQAADMLKSFQAADGHLFLPFHLADGQQGVPAVVTTAGGSYAYDLWVAGVRMSTCLDI
jgi:hypothetical protein